MNKFPILAMRFAIKGKRIDLIAQNWDNKIRGYHERKVKDLGWIGSSKKDFIAFPADVKKEMGHALYMAQEGGKHKNAKPLKGFKGATVLEIVEEDGNGTYRTMYTVRFEEVVYVLHAFQKKSKIGIKTPKQEIDLVEIRLKWAQQKYKEWTAAKRGKE